MDGDQFQKLLTEADKMVSIKGLAFSIFLKRNEPSHEKNCLRRFATRQGSNQPAQLPKPAKILKVSYIATTGIKLSRERTTKMLIRLHGCAG